MLVEIDSAQLQRTHDLLVSQIGHFKGSKEGRELSHTETRTLKTMEDERTALAASLEEARAEEKRVLDNALAANTRNLATITPEPITRATLAAIPGLEEHLRSAGAEHMLPGTRGSRSAFGSISERTDPALRTIDRVHKRGLLPDSAATVAERLVLNGEDESRGLASRWAQATGADAYASAFFKMLADPSKGHRLWTAEEQAAYQSVQQVRQELRGMTTGTNAGGELLPLFLDPAILLTSDGSTNPLRKIARVVQTTSNTWQGVTSAGVTAEWKTEASQAADATPTLAEAAIPVYFGDAFVPYSYEISMDGLDFGPQLAQLLMDAADQLQATAFTTGAGATQPTGFAKALDGTASEVAPTAAETFTSPDVYKVQNALPPRFQARAQWCAGLPTINKIAQFETTNGARLFPEVSDGQLLRRPMNECSNMKDADDINAGATADNHILAYGDWNNFIIADRIGSSIEIVENLFGANGRPTGQRGAFLWFRTGSDVVINEAFRILNVATTA